MWEKSNYTPDTYHCYVDREPVGIVMLIDGSWSWSCYGCMHGEADSLEAAQREIESRVSR